MVCLGDHLRRRSGRRRCFLPGSMSTFLYRHWDSRGWPASSREGDGCLPLVLPPRREGLDMPAHARHRWAYQLHARPRIHGSIVLLWCVKGRLADGRCAWQAAYLAPPIPVAVAHGRCLPAPRRRPVLRPCVPAGGAGTVHGPAPTPPGHHAHTQGLVHGNQAWHCPEGFFSDT